MKYKIKENLFKIILWREVLAIPTYTLLYNYSFKLFWVVFIMERIITLCIGITSLDLEVIIDSVFENENNKDIKLVIFSLISSVTLYILTLINNKKLFYILIAGEIADFIVLKLIKD